MDGACIRCTVCCILHRCVYMMCKGPAHDSDNVRLRSRRGLGFRGLGFKSKLKRRGRHGGRCPAEARGLTWGSPAGLGFLTSGGRLCSPKGGLMASLHAAPNHALLICVCIAQAQLICRITASLDALMRCLGSAGSCGFNTFYSMLCASTTTLSS